MESTDGFDGVRDTETYAIIGAAMEVHTTLGPEFLEPAYQAALEIEFGLKSIPHAREVEIPIYYKGISLGVRYRADFVCFGSILVELKALDRLTSREGAQVVHYLAASGIARGLLVNFGTARLQLQAIRWAVLPGIHRFIIGGICGPQVIGTGGRPCRRNPLARPGVSPLDHLEKQAMFLQTT